MSHRLIAALILPAIIAGVSGTTSNAFSFERVRIPVNGAVLAGEFLDAGAGAPAVLLFPMCDPNATRGWSPVAERLHAAGIGSLTIAYRGYGESTSDPNVQVGDQRSADAEAAFAYLRSRVGASVPLGVAGSSCGVYMALTMASRHPDNVRAAVALAGPHNAAQLDHIRKAPGLAVFSASSEGNVPAPEWARELKDASPNPASRVSIPAGKEHGTDIFKDNAAFANEIADWLLRQLRTR